MLVLLKNIQLGLVLKVSFSPKRPSYFQTIVVVRCHLRQEKLGTTDQIMVAIQHGHGKVSAEGLKHPLMMRSAYKFNQN